MKIEEILAKVAKGEAITEAEKKFLADYKEPVAGDASSSSVPRTRLNDEIAKRKEAEKEVEQLKTQVADLTDKVEEMETNGMSEADKAKKEADRELGKLRAQVDALTKERDEATQKVAEMEFTGWVRELATKHNFTDAEYLGFKLRAAGVKTDDANGVAAFMKGLEKDAPGMFKSTAKPGAGTAANGGQNAPQSTAKQRLEELGKKTELTNREVAEVVELQAKVKAEGADGATGNNNGGTGADGAAGKQE